MSSQTLARPFQQARGIVLFALVVGLTAGCQDFLEFEGQTQAETIPAMPEADCPVGWTGDTVPPLLADDLDQTLTQILVHFGERAESEIARRNAGTADAVRLVSLSLQMIDTSNATDMQSSFGFLAGIEIYVESSKAGSELPRVLIAWNASIPTAATTLPLQVSRDVDLFPYLEEGLRITTDLVGRSCLRQDVAYQAAFIGLVRPAP